MQSWCRTWPPNGSSRIRAKRKLLRKPRSAYRISWSRQGNQKSITLTIPSNLANLGKIFPGIIVRRHHRSETNGRAVRRVKEGTSAALLQSGLDEKWWADSTECYCFLRNIQDLLSDGKTPYHRRFGKPFNGPVIPFGAMLEYHPFLRETYRDYINSVQKSCQVYSLDVCCPRENLEGRHIMVADTEELEQMDASELHATRLNAKEVLTPMKGDN